MRSVISGLVGGLIAVFLTAYIAKRVGKAGEPGRLRFGAFMWFTALCCLAFALLPIVMTLSGHDKDFWAKVALLVGFGVAAVYCFGEVAFVHGTFDEEGIAFSTPWTGVKSERWADLSRYLSGHLSALELAGERLSRQENAEREF